MGIRGPVENVSLSGDLGRRQQAKGERSDGRGPRPWWGSSRERETAGSPPPSILGARPGQAADEEAESEPQADPAERRTLPPPQATPSGTLGMWPPL